MLSEAVYTTKEPEAWSLALSSEASVFGSVEFVSVVEKYWGYRAHLYVLQSRTGRISYPLFLRPIHALKFCPPGTAPLLDTYSPEFTGPIASGEVDESICREFGNRFSSMALEQSVVAEFIHLHPWNALLSALIEQCVRLDREIVYVDLTVTEQHMWNMSFSHACRKNIKRSRREKVRILEARTHKDIAEFHKLYIQTMDRCRAQKQYYFSLNYFLSIYESLGERARFVLAEYRDRIVAATLYLHDGDSVYSYLGGSDDHYQQVRPTNAIIYDTILWGKKHGKRRLILGAGSLPEDGIFRFKASFSPKRKNFYVYNRIHHPGWYETLCRSWCSFNQQDCKEPTFFPAYRSVPNCEARLGCVDSKAAIS
ncbi:MAG: peptidoglycan bridge formation glycyltransferase FemA/FemB family protein [Candidatus Acidiferrales bacterium]|jgi:hypothetical protein